MLSGGDVSEWPMEPASKAGVGQPTEGSNPSVTAIVITDVGNVRIA